MNGIRRVRKFRTTEPHYVILLWGAFIAAVTLGYQAVTGNEILWRSMDFGSGQTRMLPFPLTVYWMYLVILLWVPAFWVAGKSVEKEPAVGLNMVEWLFMSCVIIDGILIIFSIAFAPSSGFGLVAGFTTGLGVGGILCLVAGIALASGAGGAAGFLSGVAFASPWPFLITRIWLTKDAGLVLGLFEGYAVGALFSGSVMLLLGHRIASRSDRIRAFVRRVTR